MLGAEEDGRTAGATVGASTAGVPTLPSRVLVVDPDSAARESAAGVLRQLRVEAVVAAGSVEAERIVRESATPMAFALIEARLPGASGFQLVQRLRALAGWKDVPMAIVTEKPSDVDRLRALESGAKYFFAKPFDPIDLRRKVRRIVGTNGQPGQADLRVFPRVSVSLPVVVRRFKAATAKATFSTSTQMRNVSAGGLCFLSDDTMGSGENLRVEVQIPDRDAAIKTFAEVVWSRSVGSGFLVGAQYLMHSVEEFVPIADFVAARRIAA